MGLFDEWSWDNTLGVIAAPFTGGLSLLPTAYEVGSSLFGGEDQERAQKALIAQQQQLAREAKMRRDEQQQRNMNALAQSMLAFNPRNRMMAQMFGPEAAFSPTEFAAMVRNPAPLPEMDPSIDQTSADPRVAQEQQRVLAERAKYRQDNERRQQMVMQGMAPPGPGPAPLQMRAPAPARRY